MRTAFARGSCSGPRRKPRAGALPAQPGAVLEAILYRGELPRADVAGLIGASPRHARRVIAENAAKGVIASAGPHDELRLAFLATLVSRWTSGLFPDRSAEG